MTVTKQQQLEWLAKHMDKWVHGKPEAYLMSVDEVGFVVGLATTISPVEMIYGRYHTITREELQQERDKMSCKPAQDNSWHERGELPPVGCECEIKHRCWSELQRVTVVAITKEYAIVEDDSVVAREQHYHLRDMTFRPIRTEREKAIDEIAALVSCGLVSHEMAREFAVKMYDAGLKVVKP